MIAILSDIHSNLEAFEVVLEDLRQFDIEEIICLGDVIGYGPNPRECIRLAEQFDLRVAGAFGVARVQQRRSQVGGQAEAVSA